MKKKDILELRRRLKKDQCTFTRVSGCFVNSEKNILLKLNESFLNLDEDDYFKYLEIAKKVLSSSIGNNILQLNFPHGENGTNENQMSLIELKKSKLNDDTLLESFYQSIIDNYDLADNYLILLFHDVYDVISKTKDNIKLDESEEVYEYILFAICPVKLSRPGLSYYEDENKIKSRLRDWIVEPPINGFVFPAFIDRSADVNSLMYYTKNAKNIHPELMEDVLGCLPRETNTLKREKFQSIVKDFVAIDEDQADLLYADIHDGLNNMVEDQKALSDDVDYEPAPLTRHSLKEVLLDSGIDEDSIGKIEHYYEENFNDDLPLIEGLIDNKITRENEQRKKERELTKQVEVLKDKIDEINHTNNQDQDYDIILKVRSEKIDTIKSQVIDNQEYILIPVDDKEKTKIDEID